MKKHIFEPAEFAHMESSKMPFAIYQFVEKKVVTVMLSAGFMELFGFTDREEAYYVMDNDMYRDAHPDDVARIAEAALKFATEGGEYNVFYRTKVKDEYIVIHSTGEHIYPEEGVRLAVVWYMNEGRYVGDDKIEEGTIRRNSSISLYEASLQRKNDYDFLTGLPNMTYFFELARARRLSSMESDEKMVLGYANLNGMKHYNKKHGFAEGDVILREFANLLVKHFGSLGACRIGQDNFAFFTPEEGLTETLEQLFEEFEVKKNKRSISIRIGIYPSHMGFVETSLACDRARYACNLLRNSNKSDYCFYDDTMLDRESKRQYIIDNLDRALEEGWIKAYYQPIVRAANGRVSDEEALARWFDPEKGMLSPADFIPILEDAKLIYKVDLYMVDEIIKRFVRQKETGLYIVPISVNLSRTDFDSCDIVQEITDRMDAAGIDREKLTIEITESVIGKDLDFMKKRIVRFQELGFKVWMDDFGSGYSSLDLLQTMHFDLIKLDMRFMKQFDGSDRTKVIITELMRMAAGLNIETVTEGVETKEQVDFLREVGCTKLQGFYYCKPVPYEEIVNRNAEGKQIGFENPDESGYFETIGRINLYDMSVVASGAPENLEQYFNTLPMAVIEAGEEEITVLRSNRSYRDFLRVAFRVPDVGTPVRYESLSDGMAAAFVRGIRQCLAEDGKAFVDEKFGKNATIHAFVRRIVRNPVTGRTACAIVVLGVVKDTGRGVTYADIANSLSADYLNLYYTDLNTEEFIEYRPGDANSSLVVEKHGEDFFASARKDALKALHRDDVAKFVSNFRREIVLKAIDTQGSFTITYRLMHNDSPIYVSLKAVRMRDDPTHIIVSVNNVDSQMRQQESLERMKMEQFAYSRIAALAGNYIAIYSVDPDTGSYMEYSASKDYESMGFEKYGRDFFESSIKDSSRSIYSEDLEHFKKMFTKDNMLNGIKEDGIFMMNYRLLIDGKPTYVNLRAAIVEENGSKQLIVGVSNVDAQVRRDLETK